jgi:hypothetical protein
MTQKSFQEQVQNELKGLHQDQIIHFAWRCGLRALPFLGLRSDFSYWEKEAVQKHLMSIFYALDLAAARPFHFPRFTATSATFFASLVAYARADAKEEPAVAISCAAIAAAARTAAASSAQSAALSASAAARDTARAAARVEDPTCVSNLKEAIMEDLSAMKKTNDPAIGIDLSIYGSLWSDFQSKLSFILSSYWGHLYQEMLSNPYKIDENALERRLNVPLDLIQQGAAEVADYLQKAERLN